MTAELFDHEAFDAADALSIRVVDGGPLNAITLDERVAWSRRGIYFSHSVSPTLLLPTSKIIETPVIVMWPIYLTLARKWSAMRPRVVIHMSFRSAHFLAIS